MFLLCKPVAPYINYIIRKDFIVENLCINKEEPEKQCNGKCHLEKQVDKGVEGSGDNNMPPPPSNEREELQECLITGQLDNDHSQKTLLPSSFYLRNYSFQYVPSIFHPPMRG